MTHHCQLAVVPKVSTVGIIQLAQVDWFTLEFD
jgi:hypothetical protein